MRVGIIGAGFSGLAAAYRLSKKGCPVTVFEKETVPGGLASGFKEDDWKWPLEKHYHHWFYSDWHVRNLASEVGHEVIYKRPVSSVYVDGKIEQLDSPISLLKFSKLSIYERLRTGLVLLYFKLTPCWKTLESITAEKFLRRFMGSRSWEILWQPLFEKKFGKYADQIAASWFWARIKKRSPLLGYPEGGFGSFVKAIDQSIRKNGGTVYYEKKVGSISKKGDKFFVKAGNGNYQFDRVVCTMASPIFIKITKGLPEKYKKELLKLKGTGTVDLILSLKNQFFKGGDYWLNINEPDFPFLAIVEHTNYMDRKFYDGNHMLYVGNHLSHDHVYYKLTADQLLDIYLPYLQKINPQINKSSINKSYLFKDHFTQPIIPLNYSKKIPPLKTPIEGLYLANLQQVYPWDRGTNYAVELGEKIAGLVIKSQ